jgi:hypothetical protein
MNSLAKSLLGALAVAFASACFAQAALPENPGLADARRPAALRAEELSIPTLEERLRDTNAISFLKKIELKAEVDHLVALFRLAHAGGSPEVVTLREPYDSLLVRILAMVGKDRQLARDIAASRESIWEVLADRAQFASLE